MEYALQTIAVPVPPISFALFDGSHGPIAGPRAATYRLATIVYNNLSKSSKVI